MLHPRRSGFFAAFALCVAPAAAGGQAPVAVRIEIGAPTLPPLVDVQPGVQVLADFHEEVFFTSGWYWLRRDDGWYRAAWPDATFVYIDWRAVPSVLVDLPPGRYRRWHQTGAVPEPRRVRGDGSGEERSDDQPSDDGTAAGVRAEVAPSPVGPLIVAP